MADTSKARGFIDDFSTFFARGNVIDMAVGVVVGGAFGKITTSLVNDIVMPAVSMLIGGISFEDWKLVLKQASVDAAGNEVAEVAINFGSFLSTILDFVIIAFAVFCAIKFINALRDKMKKQEEAAEEPAPEVPPAPTQEELLAEIRDLLKQQSGKTDA